MIRSRIPLVALLLVACLFIPVEVRADSCENVVRAIHAGVSPKIDQQELVAVLRSLNDTNNKALPGKFVTKRQAQSRGWKPGKDLWSISGLVGSSIGGDRFGNREGLLPKGKWREADLDYKGGRRGGKRLVFSQKGERFVTVDHYKTFVEVPACR